MNKKNIIFTGFILLINACTAVGGKRDESDIANIVAALQTEVAVAAAPAPAPGGGGGETAPQPIRLPPHAVCFAPNFSSEDFTDLFTQPRDWQSARQQIDVFQVESLLFLDII